MKKWFSLFLCLLLMCSCAISFAETSAMTDGLYKGTARGMKGDVSIAVEIADQKIQSITVMDSHDTVFISDTAFENLTEDILEKQSLAVDMVAGATVSSAGFINAVADALTQAGADVGTLRKSEPIEKIVSETQTYDVVVVGGGIAGLTAALSVVTDDELVYDDNGLSVLVVEQLAYAGGQLRMSGGWIASLFGTKYNEKTGASMDVETIVDIAKSTDANGVLNEELLRNTLELSPMVLNGLVDRGLYLPVEDAVPFSFSVGGPQYTIAMTRDPRTMTLSNDLGYSGNDGAPWIAESLTFIAENAGVELRLETKAESLIIEDNVVRGVHLSDNEKTYDVMAKKVILATGSAGMPSSKEYLGAQASAAFFGSTGSTADGQRWAEELGGEVFNKGAVTMLGFNEILGVYGEGAKLLYSPGLWVDIHGNRFVDESFSTDVSTKYGTGDIINALDDSKAYGIIDSQNTNVGLMDTLMNNYAGWKANTIEELANQIGVPADVLANTVSTYNTDAAADGDTVFGSPKEKMVPVLEGPFYAFQIRPIILAGNASVKVDENLQILLGDGKVLEDAYAVGALMVGNLNFANSGTSHLMDMTTGYYGGQLARTAILGE